MKLDQLRKGIRFSLAFVALLWTIKALEQVIAFDFVVLGIYPRTLLGSIGIFTGPLIHGDVSHLLSNSIPLLILMIGLFYFYRPIAFRIFLLLYIMTGIWVWFAARDAYHIGASGLVYGIISFLLFSGFIRRDIKSLSLSFIIMILYGGNMFYGIIPGDSDVSWESHLLGMLAGLFCSIYYRKVNVSDNIKEEQGSREGSFEETNYFVGTGLKRYKYSEKEKDNNYQYTIDRENDQL